ncbi:NADH dehydrogenase [Tepiditoga spiralis]|uniref:NADH dehydrogenase n=1 Tax=Tepiditoga spiralis TaxID=2108365 RepID=A0A7G1G3H2_9BACT|nr:proton-conducting transporter membrane subunit [Tepiditoga spiralis]BBE30960.1 NADH dehydrogenase [Tepiditoga spiralis]
MNNPVLLITLPLLFAFLSVIFKSAKKVFMFSGLLINILLLNFIEKGSYLIGGWKIPYGINLVLDNYSFAAVLIINTIFTISVLMSYKSIKNMETVLLVSLAGLNGVVLTGDLFNLFVFLEIAGIGAYILSSSTGKHIASFKYLMLGTFGINLFLFGIILFYSSTGSLNFIDIASKVSMMDNKLYLLAITMIFVGISVESKFMPFNSWAKEVYSNTDSLTAPIFAAVYASAMMFVFGRLFTSVFVTTGFIHNLLLFITISTFLFGEIIAFSEKKLRRMLTFSSVGQAGLISTLFLVGAQYPAVMQIYNNAMSKMVMFSIAGYIAIKYGKDKIEDLQGVFLNNKILGFGFSAAALSIVGLPLFYGFYVKLNILIEVFSKNVWLPALILFATLIEGIYYIRALVKLWNPGKEGEVSKPSLAKLKLTDTFNYAFIAVIVAAIIVFLGLYPDVLANFLNGTVESLKNYSGILTTGGM